MPSSYTGVDTHGWTISANLIDDADLAAPAAALWNVPDEAALDNCAYLATRLLTFSPTGYPALGQKLATFGAPALNKDARFSAKSDGSGGLALQGWQQVSVADSGCLSWEIIPPHATASLESIEVRLGAGWGAGGSHGAFPGGKPAQMPFVKLHRVVDGSYNLSATTTDASATVGAYEAPHTLTVAGIGEDPLALGEKMFVSVGGESGANSIADSLLVMDVTFHWTSVDSP
jgi:hypothetical protein